MVYYSNFILHCIKSLDGVMVSTLDSHPTDPGSIPLTFSYFFLFSLVISRKNLVLSIKKSKTQLKNCSFNFIILSFLCMHISHIMKKRSHKVWVISVCYRFILEQCDSLSSTQFEGCAPSKIPSFRLMTLPLKHRKK